MFKYQNNSRRPSNKCASQGNKAFYILCNVSSYYTLIIQLTSENLWRWPGTLSIFFCSTAGSTMSERTTAGADSGDNSSSSNSMVVVVVVVEK